MEKIGLFFEYDGQVIQLPVNPEKLTITYDSNNKNVEIIKLGQISILKKKKLGTIQFESWFPYESWWTGVQTSGQFKSVDFYKDFFTRLQDDAKYARFIVTGYNYNTLVSVENFKYYNQGGDYEDCYYSLTLKEFVPYKIKVLSKTLTPGNSQNSNELPVIGSMDRPILQPEQITIGCSVVLNGTMYDDFAGNGTPVTKSNFSCKVLYIRKGADYPYHLCTQDGAWLGWVKESDIVLA